METVTSYLIALIGLMLLLFSLIVLAVKGKGDRVVTWRGFGVVFEVKPCGSCLKRPHK